MNGIALIGEAGSGKTSIANALCELLGWQKRAFADALRDEVGFALASMGPKEVYEYVEEMTNPDTKDRYRLILQWWGTEHRRTDDPDYWIRVMQRSLYDTNYVVDDCRFNNEHELLNNLGFKFVLLEPGPTTRYMPAHASEVDWKTWTSDYNLSYEPGPKHQAERLVAALHLEKKAVAT